MTPRSSLLRGLRNALLAIPVYACLITIAAIVLTPLFWLLCAAFKGPNDLFHYTFASPNPTIVNFRSLFHQVPFLQYTVNSTFIACSTTLLQLFFSALAGFALAKYDFRFKNTLTVIMLATMMIPGQVLLAPIYRLFYQMGLVDTYWALTIPAAVSVFGIILFRQSMLQIPDDLLDAGRIDGCSEFRLFWELAVPVTRPMIGAFTLIAFMGSWNSFLWPQIVLHSQERFTLPIALNQMIGLYEQEYGSLMAGTFLSILPVILLFFVLQKEFLAGLTAGAVKG